MIKTFTHFLACCLICVSCTKEEITGDKAYPDGDAAQTELAELTVVFSLPQTTSRANDFDNPQTEEGTDEEKTVSKAMIILGRMVEGTNAPTVISETHIIRKLEKVGVNSTMWKGVIKVNPGYYRIVAIANPPYSYYEGIDKGNFKPGTAWQKLSNYPARLRSVSELHKISEANYFMMTNAHTNNKLQYDFEIIAGKKNQALINVQRVCARIDYIPGAKQNLHSLQLASDEPDKAVNVDLKFVEAAPVNICSNFYLFKTIAFDEKGLDKTFYASEDENNFVLSCNWEEKWRYYNDSKIHPNIWRSYFLSNIEITNRNPQFDYINYKPLPEQESKLFYLTENTLPGIETQVNKLSTGVLFKAEFEFKDPEFQGLTEVYYYQTKSGQKTVYKSIETLKAALEADKMIENPNTWKGTDAEIAKCKARKFTKAADGKFYAWYSYWNRHRDNGNNNVMGKMEFAVVRNNIYRLSINSVNSLGYPEEPTGTSIWKPAGETPDELPLMLDIKVKVSDWVDRVFDYEI